MSRAKSTPESAVLKECQLWLRTHGVMIYRNNTGKIEDRTGRPVSFGLGVGSPDLIGVAKVGPCRGTMVAVECKAGRNKPTAAQSAWLAEAEAAGALCCVAWGIEDLERDLGPKLRGEEGGP